MTVTRLGKDQPLLTLGYGAATSVPSGGVSGQIVTSNGSNGSYWGENVARITSNSSNTLASPFVSLISGANVIFSVTSNALTISAATGSGGGSGAPTGAQYIVGTGDAGLSAEKVRTDLYKSYSKDSYPTTFASATDEFDDNSLDGAWSWTGSVAGTVSESAYQGFLNIDGGTDASNVARYLLRSYVPGASTAFTVATRCGGSFENGNFTQQWGIVAMTSADALIAEIIITNDGTTTGAKAYRIFYGVTPTQFATGTFAIPIGNSPQYLRFTRSTSDVYRFYFAWDDGPGWQYAGTITSSTTVSKIGIYFASDTDAFGENVWFDYVRVFAGEVAAVGS